MDAAPHDPIAALDQALAGMTNVARIVRAYHEAVLKAGFEKAEALTLTRDYQRQLVDNAIRLESGAQEGGD